MDRTFAGTGGAGGVSNRFPSSQGAAGNGGAGGLMPAATFAGSGGAGGNSQRASDRSPFSSYPVPPTREDIALFVGTALVVFSLLYAGLRRVLSAIREKPA